MDEFLFATLFLNPYLTNIGWPGVGLPEPPAFVGEQMARNTSTLAWLGNRKLVQSGRLFNCDMDGVTLSCLSYLGWKGEKYFPCTHVSGTEADRSSSGKAHPCDWFYDTVQNPEGEAQVTQKVRYSVINGIHEQFPLRWVRISSEKEISIRSRARIYIASPRASRTTLKIRPLGIAVFAQRDGIPAEKRLLSCYLDAGTAQQRDIFYDPGVASGFIKVKLALHPSHCSTNGTPSFSLVDLAGYYIRAGARASYTTTSVILKISREAENMLRGLPVPSQDCTDLALFADVVRRRLSKISQMDSDDGSDNEGSVTSMPYGETGESKPEERAQKEPPTPNMREAWEIVSAFYDDVLTFS